MREIDMEHWHRRTHFEFFNAMDDPHFSLCANVDLTAFLPLVKQCGVSINVAIVYVLTRAANAIPEFRQRIHQGQVVEHDVVHPATTILTEDDLFSFCHFRFTEDFSAFATTAAQQIAHVKDNPTLKDEPGQDDLLFLTAVPWVSFTSFSHPMRLDPVNSVPQFAWGKFFEDGNKTKMPLDVQAHHALMDGIHMGRFYQNVQDFLSHPHQFIF